MHTFLLKNLFVFNEIKCNRHFHECREWIKPYKSL